MSRNYRKVGISKNRVYSTKDLRELFEVCKNTVSNWVKEGLRPADSYKPYLFNGAEVLRFHRARDPKLNKKLRAGQFKCLACKQIVFPKLESISLKRSSNGTIFLWGDCSECLAIVCKLSNASTCDAIMKCRDTNTSLMTIDEVKEQDLAGIGTQPTTDVTTFYNANDRIIFKWQKYAGRWTDKTVASKLIALRKFERYLCGKPFDKVTADDAARFRDHLKKKIEVGDKVRLSPSTVRHHATDLREFFVWLKKQKGFCRIDPNIAEAFALPKRFKQAPIPKRKYILTIKVAEEVLAEFPEFSLKDRRDRAMFAITFLGALRADTVSTLHLGHVDFVSKTITQDARVSRTKAGKSLVINFFPLPESFVEAVRHWVSVLEELGFCDGDALFPDTRFLLPLPNTDRVKPVPTMTSKNAVESVFKRAALILGKPITPHCAKHCIGHLHYEKCQTAEERKAWSQNMGHETEAITDLYYTCIDDQRRAEIFEAFLCKTTIGQQELSDADKDLLILYHNHQLLRGTPEFERAQKLNEKYLKGV